MAFELSCEVEESDDCKSWDFIDNTGVYNVTTNPTGYGSPNVASTAIILATIDLYFYGSTVPYTFTFTIASGTITACTVTPPSGTAVSIFADLAFTSFPFSEAAPFTILPEWIGLAEGASMTYGAIHIDYNVNNGSINYSTDLDELISCSVCCCITNMEADLDAREGCTGEAINNAMMARIWLDSAVYAMEQEDVDKAQANLLYAQQLCTGGCPGC